MDQVNYNEQSISFDKQRNFDRIVYGDQYITEIGKPQLPVVSRSFVIPNDVSVADIQVQVHNEKKLTGNYYVYPAQPPQKVTISEPNDFVEPDSTYLSISVYPAQAATITFDGMVQGYHVITISYYPLGYIPGKQELYSRDISITVNYMPGNSNAAISAPISYNRANLAKAFVKSMVVNPDDVELYSNHINVIPQSTNLNGEETTSKGRAISIQEQTVPDYVLITCDSLRSTFLRLAQWKTKKGSPAVIKTVEEIEREYLGGSLQEKIRNFLINAKTRWGGTGLFVLFGGDTNIVPASLSDGYGSDVYYVADSEDGGQTSSFFGRLPVKDKPEASRFIDKLLSYEKADNAAVDYSYFENSLIVSAYMDGPKPADTEKGAYMDSCFNHCQNRSNNYWYLFDHFNCKEKDHNYVHHYNTNQGEELTWKSFLSALQNGRN